MPGSCTYPGSFIYPGSCICLVAVPVRYPFLLGSGTRTYQVPRPGGCTYLAWYQHLPGIVYLPSSNIFLVSVHSWHWDLPNTKTYTVPQSNIKTYMPGTRTYLVSVLNWYVDLLKLGISTYLVPVPTWYQYLFDANTYMVSIRAWYQDLPCTKTDLVPGLSCYQDLLGTSTYLVQGPT